MCKFKYHVYIARMILIQSYTHKIHPFEVQHAELAKSVNVTINPQRLLLSNMHFKLHNHSNISISPKTRRKYQITKYSPQTPSNLSEGI